MGLDVVGVGLQCGMDILETAEGIKISPGGAIQNTLTALQFLGLKTGFMGPLGTDEYGKMIFQEFAGMGVDLQRARRVNLQTPTCRIRVTPEDREIVCYGDYRDTVDFSGEDIPYIKNSRSLLTKTGMKLKGDFIRAAKKCGKPVFFTLHKSLPDSDTDIIYEGFIDVLFANESEAKNIDMQKITQAGTEVVVTIGENGCDVYGGNSTEHFPAYRVDSIDPTGAGDAFCAGSIYGILKEWDLEKRCLFANAMGAMATQKYGARIRVRENDVFEFMGKTSFK